MVRSSLFVSLLATASTAFAAVKDNHSDQNVVPGAFIFELEDGHDATDFYNKVEKEGKTRLKLDFELFKGVSVQLHDLDKADSKAAAMAAMPAVKKMYPVRLFNKPSPQVHFLTKPDTDMSALEKRAIADAGVDTFPPHVMTQVDKLRAKGITGKGKKIAIVDTGIDYTHPALGNGCFGPGCLVAFGTDLVGDDYTGSNTPHPDKDPMDCSGHGTHVAGIIAAQANPYGFTGAAPDVTLGIYRVFGCPVGVEGQAGNDVLIAAFMQAYEDGADIITASIGGASGWSEEPWSVAVSRIVANGVPCTISAGNSGDHGVFYSSTASQGKGVTSIASVDNTDTPALLYLSSYTVDGGDAINFSYSPGVPAAWADTKLDVYAPSFDTTEPAGGCNPYPDSTPDLSDKIVLIRRGSCTFVQKAQNAAAKGAKYVLIYNNVAGASGPDVSAVKEIIASGMVEAKTGADWIASLKAGKKVTLTVADPKKAKTTLSSAPNTLTGGALSTFTSWGPTWELDLKPQVSAPGGQIFSTWPVKQGSYAVLSGTSMACPLTAAVVALVSQVRGTLDPATLESVLSANANPQLFNDGHKFYNFLAPVPQQAGGLIQAYDAAYATTLLEPSSLPFNDTDHVVQTRTFTLKNVGTQSVTYKLSHVPALTVYTLDAGSPYPEAFPNDGVSSFATVQLSKTEVTLAPGSRALIDVSPTAPKGLDPKRLGLWSGYVAVNGTDGSSLSIPYQGLTGSLHKATVLPPNATYISDTTQAKIGKYDPIETNHTFTIPAPGNAGPDSILPVLAIDLALGSAEIRAYIIPLTTCPPEYVKKIDGLTTIGQPAGFPSVYNQRGLIPAPWDGRLDNGNYAPPGKYKFVVKALHIFGDSNKQSEFDVNESPAFRIQYT